MRVKWWMLTLLVIVGCGKKAAPEAAVAEPSTTEPASATPAPTASNSEVHVSPGSTTTIKTGGNRGTASAAPTRLSCKIKDGGPLAGPDCVTAEVKCGETVVGHTRGGVHRYDTRWYEKHTCWPGTRNHNGGDERMYVFYPDKSERFQRGETRQRVSVTFNSPCADLTFSHMRGQRGTCPAVPINCDSQNPKTRKNGQKTSNLTVDAGEVWYFLVEGADDEEGAFSLTVECGT